MADIYQSIWDGDAPNRFEVALRREDGQWPPAAGIHLDTQGKASGKRNQDLATRPLFRQVDEAKLESGTYKPFIALLDNYIVNYRWAETTTPQEKREIDVFLEAILPTGPMRRAHEYVVHELGERLTEGEFRSAVERLWFTLYTNHYNGKSTSHCSGFEHVFVGEGKYSPRFGAAETLGEISGYHSWIKFYFDERYGRVNFLGHKYDLHGFDAPTNPHVVTLQMEWAHTDLRGNVRARLFKKKGGFFVGTSPECEMAMGTVAFYESLHGRFGQKRPAQIGNGRYNLVLYRNTRQGGGPGEFIRSFYPEYLGEVAGMQTDMDRVIVEPVSATTFLTGAIRIAAAMVDPTGADPGKEWVELRNTGNKEVRLDGWELRDMMGRPRPLSGTLKANEARKVDLTRTHPAAMQLGNRAGLIALHDGEREVARVTYGPEKVLEGKAIEF
ncbi:MAG: hypothetical protein L0Y66_15010 [Myxococcaceae bacterium]|nr:hypothetical protein [Myxococcaceae bacterium]